MAEKTAVISVPPGKSIKIVKWKVRKDTFVSIGKIILLYKYDSENGVELLKFKANEAGTVKSLAAVEGEIVQPGCPLAELEACTHPTVMKDMCAECGADLRCDDKQQLNVASVPMVHSIPELKVSEELAQKLGREDSERLLKDRKLVLLVDLDQTLVHTTNDNIPANIKDVYHFQLRGWTGGGSGGRWYHARLRPGTAGFLKAVGALYELHICTFGARAYAHKVAALLDPKSELFSHRILSRDECFDVHTKTPNLKALFPCGDNLVCIIDDREDVWNRATNLIQVKPYHFFEHTGDINAPPGLEKTERDIEGQGVHLKDLNVKDSVDFPTVKNGSKLSEEMPTLDANHSNSSLDAVVKNNLETDTSNDADDESNPVEISQPDPGDKVNSLETSNKSKEDTKAIVKEVKPMEEDTEPIGEKTKPAEENTDLNVKETKPIVEKIKLMEEDSKSVKDAEINENVPLINDLPNNDISFADIDPQIELEKEIEGITSAKGDDLLIPDLVGIDSENTLDFDKMEVDGKNESELPVIPSDGAPTLVIPDEKEELKKNTSTKWRTTQDGMIDIDDGDDYLMYLEEILKRIHKFFYEVYDAMEAGSVPDLKLVIPQVKSQVLAGTSLVFSGLVPTFQKLEHSRAYMVARSLGAEVSQDLNKKTTHLVAVRPGTAKVHACRRASSVTGGPPYTVSPSWLWCCAERWQRVDEKVFPLTKNSESLSANAAPRPPRRPPPHMQMHTPTPTQPHPPLRKRTPSGRFMDTINPLLSFSSDDIADMDREVEDIFNESDESESEGKTANDKGKARLAGDPFDVDDEESNNKDDALRCDLGDISSSSESSAESLSGGEHPKGWKPGRKRRRPSSVSANESDSGLATPPKHGRDELRLRCDGNDTEPREEESTCDEFPSEKFRRGGDLPSDAPDQNESDTDGSMPAPDEIDDGEWNMMGAALEREFLGLDK